MDGLASGKFYASTGVTLTRLERSTEGIRLEIEQERDFIYTTRFTGEDGELLSESTGLTAEYVADGQEAYVRATVVSSSDRAHGRSRCFREQCGGNGGEGSEG